MGKLFRKTFIPSDLNTCWEFFSTPENLSRITPSAMDFQIKDFDGKKMYGGQRIGYTVKPLLGVKVKWLTEIRSVNNKKEFVDVQLKGPYKIWHHRHLFKVKGNGVEMIDIVHYKLPFGLFGRILEKFIVKKKVEEIFDFREHIIKEIFS